MGAPCWHCCHGLIPRGVRDGGFHGRCSRPGANSATRRPVEPRRGRVDSVGAGADGVSRLLVLAGPWPNLEFTQSSVKPAVPNHVKEMLLVQHGRYPRILALLAVSLLLAVAGCAGPLAWTVSHASSPAHTPAIPMTVPPRVQNTALPSKHLPPTT